MRDRKLDRLFDRYRRKGDVAALEQVFDATAPELLALGMHLVHDPGSAEDLLQATFLTAIERAETYDADRRLVPWLVGILVRHAFRQQRNDRREVDESNLTEKAPIDPLERAAKAELTDSIAKAIAALPTRYREVLEPYLLREERAGEIALASGRSPGTVRVQISRGLELLRRALPAGLALGAGALVGSRGLAEVRAEVLRRGAAAATKVGATSAVSATSLSLLGGLAMSQKLVFAALAAALVAIAGLIIHLGGPGPADPVVKSPPVKTERVAEASGRSDPSTDPEQLTVEPESSREELAVAPVEEEPVPRAVDEVKKAEVRGRLLLFDGTPAIGAKIQLEGFSQDREYLRRHGRLAGYQAPSTTARRDGCFSLHFEPPPDNQFSLGAAFASCAEERWRWGDIEPGEVIDVGTVTFKRAGTIAGTLVDTAGDLLRSGFIVHATCAAPAGSKGKDATRRVAGVDSTGLFRLDGLMPGPTQLRIEPFEPNGEEGQVLDVLEVVEVIAGEEISVELVWCDPEDANRIVVEPSTSPFNPLWVAADSIHLSGTAGESRTAHPDPDNPWSLVFDELEPGSYTVAIDDPRFLPWSESGIRPGTRLRPRLKGNVAIRLEVVDGESGVPVEDYQLDVRLDGLGFGSRTFRWHETGQEPPTGGLLEGLVPVPQTLLIEAEGYPTGRLALHDLEAFETRTVRAELARGTRVAGIAYEADGRTPVPGARVWLLSVGAEPRRYLMFFGGEEPFQIEAECDRNGRFEMRDVPVGRFSLLAEVGYRLGGITELVVRKGDNHSDLAVMLPPPATLRGRLIAPAGGNFLNLELHARRTAPFGPRNALGLANLTAPLDLDATGAFGSGILGSGEYALFLSGPRVTLPNGFTGSSTSDSPDVELIRLELKPGEDLERDFDLHEVWPGSLHVEVRREGRPVVGCVVVVRETGHFQGGRTGGTTGPDGSVTVEYLFPGEYMVAARAVDRRWLLAVPGGVRIEAGERLECTIDLVLFPGALRVLDERSGAPLVNQVVWIELVDSIGYVKATADGEGWLSLDLATGSYRIHREWTGGEDFPSKVPLEWTEAGPEASDICLPR